MPPKSVKEWSGVLSAYAWEIWDIHRSFDEGRFKLTSASFYETCLYSIPNDKDKANMHVCNNNVLFNIHLNPKWFTSDLLWLSL